MSQKPLIRIPEYLEYFKFIVGKNNFSSSDFTNHYTKNFKVKERTYSRSEKTPYYKEIQKWSKILQNIKNSNLVIFKTKSNKVKGSNGGRSGHYKDNSDEFFFNNYFLPNFNFDFKNKFTDEEAKILFALYSQEKQYFYFLNFFNDNLIIQSSKTAKNLFAKKIFKIYLNEIKPILDYYSKAETIDELFKLVLNKILFIVLKKGINNPNLLLEEFSSKKFNEHFNILLNLSKPRLEKILSF